MNVASQLEQVTVYASGALCVRTATVAAGSRQVRVGGFPLSLKAGSLRARVAGESAIKVLDVRPGFEAQTGESIDVSAEQKALEATQEKLSALEVKLVRAKADIEALTALRPAFREPEEGAPPREAPVQALLALGKFTDDALKPRLEKRRLLEQEVRDAREELQLHQRRLHEASSERRSARVKLTRSAVVTLSQETAGPLLLELEYLVPGARWVPTYDLRLDKSLSAGALHVRALVAQSTGEDWRGVKLALSTADLSRRTDLPELKSLRIGRSQPPAPRSGWREPPEGLDGLFQGYDELMAAAPVPVAPEPIPAPPAPPMMPSPKMAAKPLSRAAPLPPPAPSAASVAPMMQAMPFEARKSRGGVMAALGGAIAAPSRSRSINREEAAAAPSAAMDEDFADDGEQTFGGMEPQDTAELYDVVADPAEDHDLSGQHDDEAALETRLSAWMDEIALPHDFARRVTGNVSTSPLPFAKPIGDRLGDALVVAGVDIGTPKVKAGDFAEVTLIFEAIGEVPEGWRLFTHFVSDGGRMINADHEPLEGAYPLANLTRGTWLRDRVRVPVPANWPAGPMHVEIGLWRGKERLPARGKFSRTDVVRCATVEVLR